MIWGRVVDVFRRRQLEAELDSQLAHHLEGLEAEARAQGQSADDARATARRAMGGLTQVQRLLSKAQASIRASLFARQQQRTQTSNCIRCISNLRRAL